MNMHAHRRKRLLALIEDQYDGSRQLFCDHSAMSESRLAQLLSPTYRGGYGFGEKAARNLEILLGIELLYFDLFAASASSGANAYKRVAQSSAVGCDYIEIRNVALTLTAGDPDFTIQADDSDGRLIGFRCEWFKARGFQPEKLIATIARDKSMAPTIIAGDAVVINTCDTRLSDGAIYAFNYEGGQIIKRAVRDLGKWFLVSDNTNQKHYQRQECKGPGCIVIGRVVMLQREKM